MWADHFSQLGTTTTTTTHNPSSNSSGEGSSSIGGAGAGIGAVGGGTARGSPGRLLHVNGGGDNNLSPGNNNNNNNNAGAGAGAGGQNVATSSAFHHGALPSFFGFSRGGSPGGDGGHDATLEPLEHDSTGGGGGGGGRGVTGGDWRSWNPGGGAHEKQPSQVSELSLDTSEWAEKNKDLLDGLDLDD